MSAELLRRASAKLRQHPDDDPIFPSVANWLDLTAGWINFAPESDHAQHALAVARAVLREPEGGDRT